MTMALWNPLRRLFARAPFPLAPAEPAPPPSKAAPAPRPAPASASVFAGPELDRLVSAQLLGAGSLHAGPASSAEQAVLEQLAAMAEQGLDPILVPRLPAVLPKLMSLMRRDDVSSRELANLIARDPTLLAEVVRLASSPRYGAVRAIIDLQGAVLVLGQVGLAQLVARVALRPIFNIKQGRFSRSAGAQMWDLAERCGHASAALRAGRPDSFAAYLAGTAAHVGLMAAVGLLNQTYIPDEPPRSMAFHDALWRKAARLSVRAARDWAFPEAVLQVLAQRADGNAAGGGDTLFGALQAADRAAKRQLLHADVKASLDEPATDAEARADAELARAFPLGEPA